MADIKMIFDGHCLLCSGFVNFILKRERAPDFVFINAWSETGLKIAARHGLSKDDLNETYLVVSGGKAFVRSDAAFEVMRYLRAPWPALRIFRFAPKFLRDGVYNIIARNRYSWFGRSDICYLPRAGEKSRFLL